MTKPMRIILGAVVAMILAAPEWVAAQSRGGSSASSSSSQGRSAPAGAPTGGTAQPRTSAPPPPPSQPSSSSRTTASSGGSSNSGAPAPVAVGRSRNGQPIQGTAVPRASVGYPVHPVYPYYPYYPYYPFYPGYYPGFGFGFGYGYGYGYGYPYYGYPWYGTSIGIYGGGGYGGYDTGGGGYENQYSYQATGSIRLRASPSNAKVYVDGAFMGIVDDFDGLSHHLDLPVGQHQLELRADGYQTYSTTINVLEGKTITQRASLDKKK